MNKIIIIAIAVWTIISCSLTGYIVYDYMDKDIIQPVAAPVISKSIKRSKDLSIELMKNHLWHYDNDPFKIEWSTLSQKGNVLNEKIEGSLYERKFTQEAFLPVVIESKNWKLVLGFTLGAGATIGTGYIIYKLIDKFR